MKKNNIIENSEAKLKKSQIKAIKKSSLLSLQESYVGLILGLITVIIVSIFLIWFINYNKKEILSLKTSIIKETKSESTITPSQLTKQKLIKKNYPSSYIVMEGDTLWSIAEKIYSSGYNWVDIARENKITNPEYIMIGTNLNIPNLPVKMILATNTNLIISNDNMITIEGKIYTVFKGDNLWDISVRAYGDGFRWREIADENNIIDPWIIHAGNILKITR